MIMILLVNDLRTSCATFLQLFFSDVFLLLPRNPLIILTFENFDYVL